MVDPTVLVAVASLATTTAGYLAGRNRWLTRTLQSITETYEALIDQLREEIDRLTREVTELQVLRRGSSRSRRKVPPTTGL